MSFYPLLALMPALLWAGCQIIDKIVVSKYVSRPLGCVLWDGIMYPLFAIGIIIFGYKSIFFQLSLSVGLAFLSGVIYIFAILVYYKALCVEEVSRVAPLWMGVEPLLVLFLATIFFDEVFTFKTYLGFFLILIGSLAIFIRKEIFQVKLKAMLGVVLLCALIFAVRDCLWKGALESINYWGCLFWFYAGTSFTVFILLGKYRVLFVDTFRKAGKKVIAAISLSAILNFTAMLFYALLISKWFVSLSSVLGSLHGFFVLVFAGVISKFYPQFLEEEFGKSAVIIKFFAVISIILGIYFIS